MPEAAYIVDCVRTAAGRRKGRLSQWHPADLGAAVCDALVERNNFDAKLVDDVIFGCVSQYGAQSANIGRTIVLSSKHLPISVPGTTVDRQCGSGQQAIHFAAQAVMSGTQDIVIAGGTEVMSLVPIWSAVSDGVKMGRGDAFSGKGIQKRFGQGVRFSQFVGADLLARKHKITREEMEIFSADSHAKAAEATKKGFFKNEIVPLEGTDRKSGSKVMHSLDEGIRYNVSMEKLKKLKPLNGPDGLITAAAASQISDGAAAMLICNEAGLRKLGATPRAKIISLGLAGSDPVVMLGGPIPATRNALSKAGMDINQIDLYEVNEAFASVPMAWAKALNADFGRLNVNGGAIALGHPLGCTGVKLMTTLVNTLERTNKRYGLLAICEGGGTANATIIENLRNRKSKL
mmetsp:Transcript_14514/g.35369  ORF Transcript_14514/g.35369 Transcript_14514/m.35369 type:complete len:404 (-) Transcript_14514:108-1319(-)